MSQNIDAFWKGSTLVFMQSHHMRMSVSVLSLRAEISRGRWTERVIAKDSERP